MKVQVEKEHMVAQMVAEIDGVVCVVVTCHDFDQVKKLAQVVSHNGFMCGKTGWNSDTNRCHYQSIASLVIIVS